MYLRNSILFYFFFISTLIVTLGYLFTWLLWVNCLQGEDIVVYIARCYASAVYAVVVCPSVCVYLAEILREHFPRNILAS